MAGEMGNLRVRRRERVAVCVCVCVLSYANERKALRQPSEQVTRLRAEFIEKREG